MWRLSALNDGALEAGIIEVAFSLMWLVRLLLCFLILFDLLNQLIICDITTTILNLFVLLYSVFSTLYRLLNSLVFLCLCRIYRCYIGILCKFSFKLSLVTINLTTFCPLIGCLSPWTVCFCNFKLPLLHLRIPQFYTREKLMIIVHHLLIVVWFVLLCSWWSTKSLIVLSLWVTLRRSQQRRPNAALILACCCLRIWGKQAGGALVDLFDTSLQGS